MDTEQEELEALQKWWRENGRAVIVGLVLGLGGVFACVKHNWFNPPAKISASRSESLDLEIEDSLQTILLHSVWPEL